MHNQLFYLLNFIACRNYFICAIKFFRVSCLRFCSIFRMLINRGKINNSHYRNMQYYTTAQIYSVYSFVTVLVASIFPRSKFPGVNITRSKEYSNQLIIIKFTYQLLLTYIMTYHFLFDRYNIFNINVK